VLEPTFLPVALVSEHSISAMPYQAYRSRARRGLARFTTFVFANSQSAENLLRLRPYGGGL
jgi:hypothetical protein